MDGKAVSQTHQRVLINAYRDTASLRRVHDLALAAVPWIAAILHARDTTVAGIAIVVVVAAVTNGHRGQGA